MWEKWLQRDYKKDSAFNFCAVLVWKHNTFFINQSDGYRAGKAGLASLLFLLYKRDAHKYTYTELVFMNAVENLWFTYTYTYTYTKTYT